MRKLFSQNNKFPEISLGYTALPLGDKAGGGIKFGSCLAILLLIIGSLYAEPVIQAENFGNASYWGLAQGGSTLQFSPHVVWQNPAAGMKDTLQIGADVSRMPAGISISALSVRWQLNKKQILSVAINYENYGNFAERDESGLETGVFTAGQAQTLAAYTLMISSRFQLGAAAIHQANRIDISNQTRWILLYGARLRFLNDKAAASIAVRSLPQEEISPVLQLGLSNKLEYLPVELCLDYRHYGQWDYRNGSISALISIRPELTAMAGFSFQRFNFQTQILAADFVGGISGGIRYAWRNYGVQVAFFSYGAMGVSSSLGFDWHL
jgi:hypothetical protein